jgi:hypothetical protein
MKVRMQLAGSLFYNAFSLTRLYTVNVRMMMNLKGFGRKQSWLHFKVLSQHLPGGTEGKPQKISTRIAGDWGQESNPGLSEYEAGV